MLHGFERLRSIFYRTGKERTGANRAVGVAENVVMHLCEPYYRTARNVTFDNFFTSYDLAQNLRQNGLRCVGTVRKNKKFIPKDFLANKQREAPSNLFGFRSNITLLSHVPKKNKAVLFLSTLHYTAEQNENGKAAINLFYNETKGGVDTLDQLCHAYTVQRATNRWPNAFFMNLLSVGAVAAYTIYRHSFNIQEAPKQKARKKFLSLLAEQLTYDHIKKRSVRGLSLYDQSVIQQVIGPNVHDDCAESSSRPPPAKIARTTKARCHICPTAINRKARQTCGKCSKNVCNEHSVATLTCCKCLHELNSSDSQ